MRKKQGLQQESLIMASLGRKQQHEQTLNLSFHLFLTSLLILMFSVLAVFVANHKISSFDNNITNLVRQYTHPAVTAGMKVISLLGSPASMSVLAFVLIAALFSLHRLAGERLFLLVSTTGGILLLELLKWLFHRPRPDINRLAQASGYSFPSGHSTLSTILCGSIIFIFASRLPSSASKWLVTISLTLFVFLIGLSRIYLGVHYPSDVLAGFIAGGAWLTGCITIFRAARRRNIF